MQRVCYILVMGLCLTLTLLATYLNYLDYFDHGSEQSYHYPFELTTINQWWRKLKNLRGMGTKNLGLMRVTPSKTHRFQPICLLPLENFALFFILFPFLNFLSNFSSALEFQGGCPPTKNFKGDTSPVPPASAAYDYDSIQWSSSHLRRAVLATHRPIIHLYQVPTVILYTNITIPININAISHPTILNMQEQNGHCHFGPLLVTLLNVATSTSIIMSQLMATICNIIFLMA